MQINLVQPKDYNLESGSGSLRFYIREGIGGRLIADISVRRGYMTTGSQYRRKVGHWQPV